jgi:hypothetical protein
MPALDIRWTGVMVSRGRCLIAVPKRVTGRVAAGKEVAEMKRMLLTAATWTLVALAAPGVAAAAHHGKRHHHAHHATHRRHAVRAHVLDFPGSTQSSDAGASGSSSTTQSSPPASPSAGATAGTVTSFKEGLLTITLTNGTPVSGQVAEQTEIQCTPATPPSGSGEDQGDDRGQGDGPGGPQGDEGGGSSSQGQTARMSSDGAQQAGGDDEEPGQEGADDDEQACTTAALVPGAVVGEAELSLGSAGAVWDHVDLIQ